MEVMEGYPRITPFLWFDGNAEQAVEFYLSVFEDGKRFGENRMPDGRVLTIAFEVAGQRFTALNGGPLFKFTEAVSFVVRCDSQDELDRYWSKLIEGGSEGRCGWLKDKFGLSWQVIPARLPELIRNPKAMQAMMQMKKIDLGELE